MGDLSWLRAQGLADSIHRLASAGTAVAGLCGGYQMLGRVIRDPEQVESPVDEMAGLGLLPVETTFAASKATHKMPMLLVSKASSERWFDSGVRSKIANAFS